MQIVSQMDPSLYARARQKQSELWEQIIALIGGEWERGWSRSWEVEVQIALDELLEDLEYGRK
jgi:predicted NACHT family NTPase